MIPGPLPLTVFVCVLIVAWSLVAAWAYTHNRHP